MGCMVERVVINIANYKVDSIVSFMNTTDRKCNVWGGFKILNKVEVVPSMDDIKTDIKNHKEGAGKDSPEPTIQE